MDCWDYKLTNFASMANSALNCYDPLTGILAKTNAHIAVSNKNGKKVVSLRVKCPQGIKKGQEILPPYSGSYIMPT